MYNLVGITRFWYTECQKIGEPNNIKVLGNKIKGLKQDTLVAKVIYA